MGVDKDHEQVKDLIAAYVLGAVEPEEAPLIRAHILSCDTCMAEADEMGSVTASLALAVDDEPLPPGFADRVVQAATGSAEAEAVSAPVKTRWWTPVSAVAGVAALVVVAVMGASLLQTRGQLAEKERLIAALLQEDGLALQGRAGVTARMVPTEAGSYFVVAGLEEAPAERTYQLWLLRDGQPTSVGTFEVSDGIALIETEHDIERFDAAAVTVEPAGGSPGPTTEPILISS